jgi:hypothetical protein
MVKQDGFLKQVVVVFVVALVFYIAAYWAIEYRRNRLGPWQVTFTREASGSPEILIDQPSLFISNVCIAFSSATASATNEAVVTYAQPRSVPYPVPFGRCVFMDTTTLPGTLVFELFGHEIQLLPRTLTIDKQERTWHSSEIIVLNSTNGSSGLTVRQ